EGVTRNQRCQVPTRARAKCERKTSRRDRGSVAPSARAVGIFGRPPGGDSEQPFTEWELAFRSSLVGWNHSAVRSQQNLASGRESRYPPRSLGTGSSPWKANRLPFEHGGQRPRLTKDGEIEGCIGRLHGEVAAQWILWDLLPAARLRVGRITRRFARRR